MFLCTKLLSQFTSQIQGLIPELQQKAHCVLSLTVGLIVKGEILLKNTKINGMELVEQWKVTGPTIREIKRISYSTTACFIKHKCICKSSSILLM